MDQRKFNVGIFLDYRLGEVVDCDFDVYVIINTPIKFTTPVLEHLDSALCNAIDDSFQRVLNSVSDVGYLQEGKMLSPSDQEVQE